MATIIDALLVTLGLDASSYKKGQGEAKESLRKTKDEATKTAKEIELRGKQAAAFFTKLRNEAVALWAVFSAGRGLKDFARDITSTDAATGRLAKNLNISVSALTEWRGAVERAGGTSDGLDGTLEKLTTEFETYRQGGPISDMIVELGRLGVTLGDGQGHLRALPDILKDAGEALSHFGVVERNVRARRLGLDQGTTNLIGGGRVATEQELAHVRARGTATQEDTERAETLRKAIYDVRQNFESLARSTLNELTPVLIQALKGLDGLLTENRPKIAKALGDAFKAVATALKGMDWKQVKTDITAFGVEVQGVIDLLGGWKQATEILFGLWALGKLAPILSGLGVIRGALTATTSVASGLLDALGLLPAAVALVLPLALKGDTDPNATPDGFRPGWKPDNGEGGAKPGENPAVSRGLAQAIVDATNIANRESGRDLTGVLRRLSNWLDRQFGGTGTTAEQQREYESGATPSERVRGGQPTYAGRTPSTAEQQERAGQLRDALMAAGYTEAQAAGIAANIRRESRFDPNARGDPDAHGVNQAVGLGQWHPDRVRAIMDGSGIDVRSAGFADQVRALIWELSHSEGAAGQAIRGEATPRGAGGATSRRYLRPGVDEAARAREERERGEDADALWWQWQRAGRPLGARVPLPRTDPAGRGGVGPQSMNDNSSQTTINGNIVVHTAATDAQGIARDIRSELSRRAMVHQANRGLG